MIVSISGYTFSGTGAVLDLLQEYEETTLFEPELGLIYWPDGLLDLDYHLRSGVTYLDGDAAIYRFWNLCRKFGFPKKYRQRFLALTREYLNDLVEATWQGSFMNDGTRMDGSTYAVWRCKNLFSSAVYHFFHTVPHTMDRTVYLAHHIEQFPVLTGRYLEQIASLVVPKDKITVFNHLFSAYQMEMCMQYTPDAKAIVVDRDPRDVYILGKITRRSSGIPVDNAQKFVAFYRRCWQGTGLSSTPNILRLRFEDVVYHYEDSVRQIESFLDIRRHISPRKYFKPEVSINNTQLKERFPELAGDIAYIEETLAAELYPFPEIRVGKGMFF